MRAILAFACFTFFLVPQFVQAQLRLPQPSPAAMVMQTIGLTEITLKYHTPGVKGREVWGKLVPYNEVWRTGANEATLITFSDAVKLNGENVAAGTYSLYSLPESADSCLFILNKNTSLWGAEGYDPKDDILRIPAQVKEVPTQETFQFVFSDVLQNTGTLSFFWERKKVSVKIEVDTDAKVLAMLQEDLTKAKPDDWQIYAQATNYLISKNTLHELALKWIDKSLSINDNFYNNWIKAQLLAQKDEYEGAVDLCKKAIKLGKKDQEEYKKYESNIERNFNVWKFKRFEANIN
ncbi:DUF2911 domain-containing protein [Adhaeribacter radiodurans]|uniref:DUF2911 domain-containing protein n=1 Tax=Adhaeribacter radiodurans TaxID=2745197 RepID=A0A7L7L6M8_9BACT|nr:DUF2911 domain-containing protein [Adhaeribacter radiodurans]QMU28433.1 DUF2911 domain-containing protein [Adhaeribacter radiodurans]